MRSVAHKQVESSRRDDLLKKSTYVALVCVQTFNVEAKWLSEILASEENAATLLECSIIISESRFQVDPEHQLQSMLFFTWKRTLHAAYQMLAEQIVKSECLDDAISRTRGADNITGNGTWTTEATHWVKSDRRMPGSTDPQTLQFNILTAELLTNGDPSGKLPSDFEQHPLYHIFFGSTRLEVERCCN
jgi:hypothetical protein